MDSLERTSRQIWEMHQTSPLQLQSCLSQEYSHKL